MKRNFAVWVQASLLIMLLIVSQGCAKFKADTVEFAQNAGSSIKSPEPSERTPVEPKKPPTVISTTTTTTTTSTTSTTTSSTTTTSTTTTSTTTTTTSTTTTTMPEAPPAPTDISCQYSFLSQVEPVPFVPHDYAVLSESVTCKNLPVTAEVRLVGTRNATEDVNEKIISSVRGNGSWGVIRKNEDRTKTGNFTRRVEVRDVSSRKLLFVSGETNYVLSPPLPNGSCTLELRPATWMSSFRYVVFGSDMVDIVRCANLPASAVVRIHGTKDGQDEPSQLITLEAKANSDLRTYVAGRAHDSASKVGLYKRQVVVTDSGAGRVITTSNEQTVEFMPDTGCEFKMTEIDSLSIQESADCRSLPIGARVLLWEWNEAGFKVLVPLQLPYLVNRNHNDKEMLGPNLYAYKRIVEVWGPAPENKLYHFKEWTFYFPKSAPSK